MARPPSGISAVYESRSVPSALASSGALRNSALAFAPLRRLTLQFQPVFLQSTQRLHHAEIDTARTRERLGLAERFLDVILGSV
jgi:hypothetical protein